MNNLGNCIIVLMNTPIKGKSKQAIMLRTHKELR